MTVDAEGGLWVTHWDGWRISRLLPDGTIDGTIELPVARVTSCVFGGPSLETLFLTSASIGLDEAERAAQPLAGRLVALFVGVKGLPTQRFSG